MNIFSTDCMPRLHIVLQTAVIDPSFPVWTPCCTGSPAGTCPWLTCQLAPAAPSAGSFDAVLSLSEKPTCHGGTEPFQEDAYATPLPVPHGSPGCHLLLCFPPSICPFLQSSSKRSAQSVLWPWLPPSREHQESLGSLCCGSQAGHSISSPPGTGDASPGWPRPPDSRACSEAEPDKASQRDSKPGSGICCENSLQAPPSSVGGTHFPAEDGSLQMLFGFPWQSRG